LNDQTSHTCKMATLTGLTTLSGLCGGNLSGSADLTGLNRGESFLAFTLSPPNTDIQIITFMRRNVFVTFRNVPVA